MMKAFDEKKMSMVQKELETERIEAIKQIIKNLQEQKKIEIDHLDLVSEHLKFWKKEIESTHAIDKDRIIEFKDKLKMEQRIEKKIKDHIKRINKEIKFQEEHIH